VVIAIDGPSGVGKSTVSRAVADRLGLSYLDTGSTYRAATLAILQAGVDPTDGTQCLEELQKHAIDYDERGILLDGQTVTSAVRSAEVTANVSAVSAHPTVRAEIVAVQRRWIALHDDQAVVEGRDIGTVVFPDADVKVYLTASPQVRAERRASDNEAEGKSVAEIAAALAARDRADSERKASPLRPADGATIIDTGPMGINDVVEAICTLAASTSKRRIPVVDRGRGQGGTMTWFKQLPMAPYVIAVSVISGICWVVLDGKVPLVISMLAGGSIALKGALSSE
jgi:cytidylate kinase